MFLNFFILISDFLIRSKKLYLLFNEFCFFMRMNWILEIPKFIKKEILNFPLICKKIGIDYVWVFSEKKSYCFLCLSKIPKGPLILFKLLKFSLKNEIVISKKKYKNFKEIPILLLNNFSSILENEIIIETTLKDVFFFERRKKLIFQKQKNVIFFDFLRSKKIIECRFYKFWGTILLFPRVLRKKNFLINKNNIRKNYNKERGIPLNKKKTTCLSSLILEEVGPRLTFKLLEVLERYHAT
ncbi:hypothetical protein CMESO_148 (nucleomorph) [Chroomonas mesostigmatica CCMP1168]|uniref:Brix domain-containing protein n=1 Tax=Chroomonas mesostigmatica CCMP1168 TaxID=1195612 RepID=J7G1G7_9CRYP|nr:hypothetical protein CMESO_148 [Chroomonas mesostigmatica CCMP1168]|mmetsp:Transcript_51265/g.124926  ORF Transcript_51265/g.124926 Transcript_51265/m.124926 type:complete len:241 (-) Transcript_51265:381-1103(-)